MKTLTTLVWSVIAVFSLFCSRVTYGDEIEDSLLKKYPEVFSRSNDSITLHLQSGKDRVYRIVRDDTESRAIYQLTDYLPDSKMAVMSRTGYESFQGLLVSTQKDFELKLCGLPEWSPDYSKFIAKGLLPIGDGAEGYQIGSCVEGVCKIVTQKVGQIESVVWKNNSEYEVKVKVIKKVHCRINGAKVKCT